MGLQQMKMLQAEMLGRVVARPLATAASLRASLCDRDFREALLDEHLEVGSGGRWLMFSLNTGLPR